MTYLERDTTVLGAHGDIDFQQGDRSLTTSTSNRPRPEAASMTYQSLEMQETGLRTQIAVMLKEISIAELTQKLKTLNAEQQVIGAAARVPLKTQQRTSGDCVGAQPLETLNL